MRQPTALNTGIQPNILVSIFCGNAKFPQSFYQFFRNSVENVRFHKIFTLGNQVKFQYFAQWPFLGVQQNSPLEKFHKAQRKTAVIESFFRNVTCQQTPWKVFFYETCKFLQNNVFREDLTERLALFISQLTETFSEPSHTSKMERFAKIANDLPAFRLDSQHVFQK